MKANTIKCERHGVGAKAFVCGHLLHGQRLGFHFDSNDIGPYPDAWCSECEGIRAAHGGEWNDESEALIEVRLVCGSCYEEIRSRNAVPQVLQ